MNIEAQIDYFTGNIQVAIYMMIAICLVNLSLVLYHYKKHNKSKTDESKAVLKKKIHVLISSSIYTVLLIPLKMLVYQLSPGQLNSEVTRVIFSLFTIGMPVAFLYILANDYKRYRQNKYK